MIDESRKQLKKNIGVYCLTTNPTDVVMWAHYGGNHSGIALEFEYDENFASGSTTFEVDYDLTGNESLNIEKFINELVNAPDFSSLREKGEYIKNSSFKPLFFCKTPHWKYELEWRVLNQPGLQNMPAPLKAIIFGTNVKQEVIDYIESQHDLRDVEFKYLGLNKEKFEFKLVTKSQYEIAKIIK
ncbi:DUF2971 domain-containing protein [Enterovibrio norvegicus]|uniref:DUF2971 domain-containing protein n=1 Tax=Enterovibrio norvegicus TaxID=188144 RepID=UPI00354E67D7